MLDYFMSLPKERLLYLLQNLPAHLKQAEELDKLHRILTTFEFLQQKAHSFDPRSLVADFDDSQDGDLLDIQEGIRLATHLLLRDSSLLATQLHSRLIDNLSVSVQELLRQIETIKVPWLRLLSKSLPQSGSGLIRTFTDHENSATCIALMLDGHRVVSGSRDRTLILWDIETGTNQTIFYGHAAPIIFAAISPNELRIVSGDEDGKIIIWDNQGQLLHELIAHSESITQVAFIAGGQSFISASTDGTVRIWDADSGELQLTIPALQERIMTFDVTSDEAILLTGGSDGTIKGWSLPDGQAVFGWKAFPGTVTALCALPQQNSLMALAADSTLKIWAYPAGQEVRTIGGIPRHDNQAFYPSRRLAVTPDGKTAAYAFGKLGLRVVDLETGEMRGSFQAHSWPINALKFSLDGNYLITAAQDATLRIWKFNDTLFRDNNPTKHRDDVTAVAFVPNIPLGVSCSLDSTIKFWDLSTGELITTVEEPGTFLYSALITMNGQYLITAGYPRSVVVWDVAQRAVKNRLTGYLESPFHVALSTDNKRMFAIASTELIEWDIESGEKVNYVRTSDHRFVKVFATPDHNFVIVACNDNTARVIDLQKRIELASFEGHHDLIESLVVLPESDHVISGGRDGSMHHWAMSNGQHIAAFKGHSGAIKDLAWFCIDNHFRVISASADHLLKIWNVDTGTLDSVLQEHLTPIIRVTVARDIPIAVSISSDESAALWNLETRQFITRFCGEARPICCTISDDGRTIMIGEIGGQVHVMRLENGD